MMSVIEINYSSGKLFFLNIFHIYKYTIWFSNLLIFWIKESNMQRLIDEWAIGHGIYTCNNVVCFFYDTFSLKSPLGGNKWKLCHDYWSNALHTSIWLFLKYISRTVDVWNRGSASDCWRRALISLR